jgi:hypothetical protein
MSATVVALNSAELIARHCLGRGVGERGVGGGR